MDQGSQVDLKNITVPEVHIQAATPEIPEDENQTFNDSLESEPLELDSDTKNGSAKPSHPLQSNASQQVPTPKGSPTRQSLQQSPTANHSSKNQPLRQGPASGESSVEQVPVPVAPSSRRPSQQGAEEANEQPSGKHEEERNGETPDQTLLKRLFIVTGLLYRGFLGFMEPFYSSFKIAHPMLATFLVYFEDVYNSWLDFICTYDSIWDIKLSDILKKLGCSMSRAIKSLPVTMRKTLKTVHKSFCYSREEVRETLCMWETLFAILLPPKEGEVPLFTITEAERSGDKFLQLYFKLTANAAKRLSNRFINYVASLIPFFKKPSGEVVREITISKGGNERLMQLSEINDKESHGLPDRLLGYIVNNWITFFKPSAGTNEEVTDGRRRLKLIKMNWHFRFCSIEETTKRSNLMRTCDANLPAATSGYLE